MPSQAAQQRPLPVDRRRRCPRARARHSELEPAWVAQPAHVADGRPAAAGDSVGEAGQTGAARPPFRPPAAPAVAAPSTTTGANPPPPPIPPAPCCPCLHRHWAHPSHTCVETGLTPATSVLRREWPRLAPPLITATASVGRWRWAGRAVTAAAQPVGPWRRADGSGLDTKGLRITLDSPPPFRTPLAAWQATARRATPRHDTLLHALMREKGAALSHICSETRPHLRRDSTTSAPGLDHICAGTRPQLSRGSPVYMIAS